jgi:endonuclease/exonuclease/phosphatase (EEP) superfamily protein YafD
MSNTITELPVERDQYGYWTHQSTTSFAMAANTFQRMNLTPGWALTVFGRLFTAMKMKLTRKSMVTISHHGNLNPQTVRVGLLALSMTVRMARYVFGCAQPIAEERSHDYRHQ